MQDAAYWREQAQKLQATLDDPRKLEEYFSAKAQRDHDAAPIAQIDLANTPMRGPAEAPVTVVEYSDFLCPYCRQLAQALAGFVPQAGGRIKVYFKNYPLEASCNPKIQRSIHTGSCALALGGLCAQYQGKFEAYHDRVFATEMRSAQPSDVVRLAGEAGLNPSAMEGCLDDPKTKAALDAQIAEGNRLGITLDAHRVHRRQEAAPNQLLRGSRRQGGPQEGLSAPRLRRTLKRHCVPGRLTRPLRTASLASAVCDSTPG